jgi:hypothetical protein
VTTIKMTRSAEGDQVMPDAGTQKFEGTILLGRKLLSCGTCGWVHYVMSAEEKLVQDQAIERYHLDPTERLTYEAAFRQCLRCESPLSRFRDAVEGDLNRAAGHIVTPVLTDST